MSAAESQINRTFVFRAEHDSEFVQFLTEFAKEKKIKKAFFTAIGAVKRAKLGYYDQQKHEYISFPVEGPHEIASCIGNISLKNGEPFVHAHAVLADEKGDTKAGHFFEGIVFAAEIHLQELAGPDLVREHDKKTDLSLWRT